MYTQDINKLTISGHVAQPPQLHGDPDDGLYRFVLAHTTHAYDRNGWEQHHYNVLAYGDLGEALASRHQPGQVVVVMGELDLQLQDTLIGSLSYVSIVAQRIITVDGPLNLAEHAAAPDTDLELRRRPSGPSPARSPPAPPPATGMPPEEPVKRVAVRTPPHPESDQQVDRQGLRVMHPHQAPTPHAACPPRTGAAPQRQPPPRTSTATYQSEISSSRPLLLSSQERWEGAASGGGGRAKHDIERLQAPSAAANAARRGRGQRRADQPPTTAGRLWSGCS
jgi:single-stranded DNA-binding protein